MTESLAGRGKADSASLGAWSLARRSVGAQKFSIHRSSISRTILAGAPPAKVYGGTSLVTSIGQNH
jgi:hypothetical protein